MKKIYKVLTATTNYTKGITEYLNKLAEEGFYNIESVTYLGDSLVLIIVSRFEYEEEDAFTTTERYEDPEDLEYEDSDEEK